MSYFQRMVEVIQEGIGKVVRYVSTPLQALTLMFIFVCSALWWAPVPELGQFVLMGLMAVILFVICGLLIFNNKRLQFTAEEQMIWRRERLGDSETEKLYYIGEAIAKTGLPPQSHLNEISDETGP